MLTHSLEETKLIGKQLVHDLRGGDILCLYGELGAGKTVLTKGIAEGLSITDNITSPTFTLMNIYKVTPEQNAIQKLVHIDTYRFKDDDEFTEIGAEDYLGASNTLCIIEWPEKITKSLIGKNVKKITIKHLDGDNREILLEE